MSATERRAELEQAVKDAKAAEHRLRDQQRQAQGKAAELTASRHTAGRRVRRPRRPEAEDTARRLKDQVDAATSDLWGERIKVAEQDTKAARVAYDRFTQQHLVDLVKEREAGDVQAVVDLDDALAGVERAVRTLHARAAAHGDLMRGVQGLDVRREPRRYDNLNGLLKVAKATAATSGVPPRWRSTPSPARPQPDARRRPMDLARRTRAPGPPRTRTGRTAARQERRNAQLRRANFDFSPEPQTPADMSQTEWIMHRSPAASRVAGAPTAPRLRGLVACWRSRPNASACRLRRARRWRWLAG